MFSSCPLDKPSPHCRVAFKKEWRQVDLAQDPDGWWEIHSTECADCERTILVLRQDPLPDGVAPPMTASPLSEPPPTVEWMIWPRTIARSPIPPGVPQGIAKDYTAACRVLAESPEASAALSRRCLQNLLVAMAEVKEGNLDQEIQTVIDSGILPRKLGEDLDVVRVIGNFGTHPMKSQSTGQIVDVEPGGGGVEPRRA